MRWILFSLVLWMLSTPVHAQSSWSTYGGTPGGTRYMPYDQIDRSNVHRLQVAWTYETGELAQDARSGEKLTFEATPIFFEGALYVPTAFGKIIALDATTGAERWTYDPEVNRTRSYSEVTSRGVSLWIDDAVGLEAPCQARIVAGTIDARLIAVDARTGHPCTSFGKGGAIDLNPGFNREPSSSSSDYQVTSPPAVIHDLVVVGSSIGDNWNVDTGRGAVRAFDARTGELRWQWDPIPHALDEVGAANAWSAMAVDEERDLLFIPTSSPSPDFYGGKRPGANAHANAVVALRGSTGELEWAYQTIHHDLWDYDLAAQPALVEIERDGERVPAVAQATKTGMLFVLHRETGRPLFPVEERPVLQSDLPGEASSATQPFVSTPVSLMPHEALNAEDAWGPTEAARAECRALFEKHRSNGIFTPPGIEGTLMYPGNSSGTNWGSTAFDPERNTLVLNTSRLVTLVQLFPAEAWDAEREKARREGVEYEFGRQRGAPYAFKRRTLISEAGMPCNPPPWGELFAVDLDTGEVTWSRPLGMWGPVEGAWNSGGPIVTGSGLVFIAATLDQMIRAFDIEQGELLWEHTLPHAGIATPMTYEVDGKQYVVIAAGGHGKAGLEIGDDVIAFALPE